jgi:hypothetical protein
MRDQIKGLHLAVEYGNNNNSTVFQRSNAQGCIVFGEQKKIKPLKQQI